MLCELGSNFFMKKYFCIFCILSRLNHDQYIINFTCLIWRYVDQFAQISELYYLAEYKKANNIHRKTSSNLSTTTN